MTPTLPRTLEIGDEVGSGAVATVHTAHDPDQGCDFAAKILHASHQGDAGAVARFAREANVVRDVIHPNVVRVYGMVDVRGTDAVVMELVRGQSLREVIARRAPLPRERLITLTRGIAAGLGAAHSQGIIHRDLKPANILVTEQGEPKIADFGMARASSFAGVNQSTYAVLGTPDYMAPESVEPLEVGTRSDLYALGCMMVEMATGQPPYAGATSFALLRAHREEPPPDLPAPYGPGLAALVKSLLAKSPADRPTSASAVIEALDALNSAATAALETAVASVADGTCARCGAPIVRGLPICLDCTLPQAHVEPGDLTVFVVGPAHEIGDKLDSALRDRLLQWTRANGGLGINGQPLEKFIPRVPFPFIVGVSQRSADGLRRSLEALGLKLEISRGGRFALPAIRKKARRIGLRGMGIVLASMGYAWHSLESVIFAIPVAAFGAFALTGGRALRAATRRPTEDHRALPKPIRERLDKIATLGSALQSRRHREGLRALTGRAVAMVSQLGTEDQDMVAEVSRALDLALVATGRMDTIDTDLAPANLQEPDGPTHALLRERDIWSSRLLELDATLESFHGRLAMAGARAHRADDVAQLTELRARIEALEEVST